MFYPGEFVEKVLAEYPDRPEVRAAAERGKCVLGVHLARGAVMIMTPEDIVASIDTGDCRRVREEASTAVRRRSLHAEWMRIMIRNLSTMVSESVPPPSARRRPALREASL